MVRGLAFRAGAVALGFSAAGCAQQAPKLVSAVASIGYSTSDRDCLARAMYFESHRGGDDGMLAVGTVVANRLKSGAYGSTICEIVGQKGQFAAGVMTRPMDDSGAERARRVADQVLSGKRHPGARGAMFFHTAGLSFRYPNMHYVLVAGGNAFYEKHEVASAADAMENARSRALALAYAKADPTAAATPILVASNERLGPATVAAMRPVGSAIAPAATTPQVVTTVVASAAAPVVAPLAVQTPAVQTPAVPTLRAAPAVAPPARPSAPAEPMLASIETRPAKALPVLPQPKRTIDVAAASEPALAAALPVARKAAKPAAAPVVRPVEVAKVTPAAEPASDNAWQRVASAFSSMPEAPAIPQSSGAAAFSAPAFADSR